MRQAAQEWACSRTSLSLLVILLILHIITQDNEYQTHALQQKAIHHHAAVEINAPSSVQEVPRPHMKAASAAPVRPRSKPYTPKEANSYSFHHCLLQPYDARQRRCKFGNICIHRGTIHYLLDGEDRGRQPLGMDFSGHPSPPLPSDAQDSWLSLDTRGAGWAPKVKQMSVQEFAREQGAKINWHRKPLYFFLKHACGNAGHCMMESMFPIMADMLAWGKRDCAAGRCDWFDNTILMHEHVNNDDCGCGGYQLACGTGASETPKLCNLFVNNTVRLLSDSPPVYLNQLPSINGDVVDCFLEAYAGHGGMNPYVPDSGRDFSIYAHSAGYLRALRDTIYSRVGVKALSLASRSDRLAAGEFHVLAHRKTGRRMIKNFDEVAAWLNGLKVRVDDVDLTIKLKVIRWEEYDYVEDQLNLLGHTDMLLTAAGSASFQAWMLPDETAMVTTVFCDQQNGNFQLGFCNPFEFRVVHSFNPVFQSFYYTADSMDELSQSSVPTSYDVTVEKGKFMQLFERGVVAVVRGVHAAAAVWDGV